MSNLELVRQLYAAFSKGDIETVVKALADDVEWTETDGFPHGGTYIGPDAVVEGVFSRIGGEWDPFIAEMDEFLDAGDHVIALGRYRGTYTPTGATLDAPVVVVWTVGDGKVVRFRQVADTASLYRAVAAESS